MCGYPHCLGKGCLRPPLHPQAKEGFHALLWNLQDKGRSCPLYP